MQPIEVSYSAEHGRSGGLTILLSILLFLTYLFIGLNVSVYILMIYK